jgi:uncharacterized membrane protein YhhN
MIPLSIAALVFAAITIGAHYLHPPRLVLVGLFKPLTTVLILLIAALPGAFLSQPYARIIVLGLLFSLAGDILLVLPRDRFLAGLAAFLVAQLLYAFAFRAGARTWIFPWTLLALAAVAVLVLSLFWRGVAAALRPAVAVYVAAISLMAALGISRGLALPSASTLLAGAGALLFLASDAMLAFARFRRKFALTHLSVLATYFVAQWLIALSVPAA